ncbi:hypothetical protein M1O52_03920 [Dehalococcoidia bacterium]|nr:hypothetical protein [Dehalococcoidia bacterium]
MATIKLFFNYLVENEGLELNPAASIRSPKIAEKEPVYLTDEGSIRLLRTIAREARPQVQERDMAPGKAIICSQPPKGSKWQVLYRDQCGAQSRP